MRKHNGKTLNSTLPRFPAVFTRPCFLASHIKVAHHNERFMSNGCSKTFGTSSGLRTHEKWHDGIFTYLCPTCGQGFNYKSRSDTHMTKHSGEKLFVCSSCNKNFNNPSNLAQHKNICGVQTRCHVCPKCPKKFKCRIYLKEHLKIHEDPERYQCTACGDLYPTELR